MKKAISIQELIRKESEIEEKTSDQNLNISRRTKIACTISENSLCIDELRMLYQAGMNIIRINMAYSSQKVLEKIAKLRHQLEKEYECFMPIIVDLKGSIRRLGRFDSAYGVSLKAGDEFRISTEHKIIGDKNIVSCDCNDLGMIVEIGDKILVDYGRTSLTVKKIEKESESLSKLKEKYPLEYQHGFKFQTKTTLKRKNKYNMNDSSLSSATNSETDSDAMSNSGISRKGSDEQQEESRENEGDQDTIANFDEPVEKSRKYIKAFKTKKCKIEKDVILCTADNDCHIKSEKPFFLYSKKNIKAYESTDNLKSVVLLSHHESTDNFRHLNSNNIAAFERRYPFAHNINEEEEEYISPITVRDIKDLNNALKYEMDTVVISEVRQGKDVREARYILGNNSTIRIVAKIQNAEALQNFNEILNEADGIMISRGYLSVHIPVEKLFFKQKEIIRKCHEARKPVIIVSQLIESMVTSIVPTTSETNDISNLILDGVDILALVNETTYGNYKKEAVETVTKICREIESKAYHEKHLNMMQNMAIINNFYKINTIKETKNIKKSISDTIAQCVVNAIEKINGSLIICFSHTGSTVLKISKLWSKCPIIAVTSDYKVARQCTMLASVSAIKIGSMYGRDELTRRILEKAYGQKFIKKGDFVVITYGEVEGVPNTTNSMKILQF